MTTNLSDTIWQQRYKASSTYTLSCKVIDKPGKLATILSAIDAAGGHVGDITASSVEGDYKIQDITLYCNGKSELDALIATLNGLEGVEILAWRDEVLETHRGGTIDMVSRTPIKTVNDLRMVYTPGVASVCKEIEADLSKASTLTGLQERVGIVTNGTAVLGLGDIGVLPSLPVMEGKASIFAEFVGLSAIPVLVESKDVDEIVETVAKIAKGFGAIQLEDIAAPACFEIENRLQEMLDIPVLHDDQHGTSTVTLAAIITALKLTNKKASDCNVLILGAGAAGYAIANILLKFGVNDVVVYDSTGAIYDGRTEKMNPQKEDLAKKTNKNNEKGSLADAFKNKDIFIGVARPYMVSKEMVASMNPDPIVFPLSNPIGEITVEEAQEAGAAITADGRSINNALVYPGLFRGALDAGASAITYEMQIAAAETAASLASGNDLLPDMLDREVHRKIIAAVRAAWK